MYVTRTFFLVLIFSIFSGVAEANKLDLCLESSLQKSHRLDQEESIRDCFENHKINRSFNSCLQLADKLEKALVSSRFEDEIRNLCFIESTLPESSESCMKATRKFKNPYTHDDAVFMCFQTFQDKMNKPLCLKHVSHMIFPLKKDYLKKHCNESFE